MKPTKGYFIISLDFELFWGVFDVKKLADYKKNLLNVREIIPRLLELSRTYGIKLTFATVGCLFARSRNELLAFIPDLKPTYEDGSLNPYLLLSDMSNSPENNACYFAHDLLESIKNEGSHEISSHTFSHYYCNEKGQNINQFKADLEANIKIAKANGVELKSIVFPRNQINKDYLQVAKDLGFTSYRGTEKHKIHSPKDLKELERKDNRILRLFDSFFNLTGNHTYDIKGLCSNILQDVPSSRFLRPYSKTLKFLEPLKIKRIKSAMTEAAENNEMYHLWWHPHNFGDNLEENFKNLELLFQHYAELRDKQQFESVTMTEFTGVVNPETSVLETSVCA